MDNLTILHNPLQRCLLCHCKIQSLLLYKLVLLCKIVLDSCQCPFYRTNGESRRGFLSSISLIIYRDIILKQHIGSITSLIHIANKQDYVISYIVD